MACEQPEKKKFKPWILSDHIFTADFQDLVQKNWQEHNSLEAPNISVISKPFRVCKISNFIKNESFMEELKTELSEVKSRRQSIDLYQFEQTNDLANVDSANLRKLFETFETDLTPWMEQNTGIDLNRKISMSSSCYYDTDYLLCHDDNMGDRRIAFVFYLSKNWTAEDGGSLDLFDTDENGLPRKVVRSLVPEYNSLVFFEVLDNSYHQVAEVTSLEKSRWTVNGWFHGPRRATERASRPKLESAFARPENIDVDLGSWIKDSYLLPDIVKEIHSQVEHQSYTFLANFLKPEMYERLSRDVASETISWVSVGPADVRNYEIADERTLPETFNAFYAIFKSLAVFKLLKDYTELDLVPDESTSMDPKMSIELQRWSRGCYTLICDRTAGYEHSTKDDKPVSSSPPPTSNGAAAVGSHASYNRSRKDRKTRQASVSSCENEQIEEEEGEDNLNGAARAKALGPKSSEIQQPRTPHQQQVSPSKLDSNSSPSVFRRRAPVNPDSEDSDVSDIGDYLSDPLDCSLECSEAEDDCSITEPGTLDVIMQFHTSTIPEDSTIDYVDPREEEGALIHVPSKDNHLCLVFKTVGTSRLHKYVNHYCKGYSYNLICTYYQ